MRRIALDLNKEEDRSKTKSTVRRALGLVPGQPNQGLVAETPNSPARLAEYDDSAWELCQNVGEVISTGFTFAWWRITVELPESIDGVSVAGATVLFETNIDDYGEVWIDGTIDRNFGTVAGFNRQSRQGPHQVYCASRPGQVFGTEDGSRTREETRLPDGVRGVFAGACG